LVASIESLEKSGLLVEAQIKILDNVENEETGETKIQIGCAVFVLETQIYSFLGLLIW
jgi:hypothetical protein